MPNRHRSRTDARRPRRTAGSRWRSASSGEASQQPLTLRGTPRVREPRSQQSPKKTRPRCSAPARCRGSGPRCPTGVVREHERVQERGWPWWRVRAKPSASRQRTQRRHHSARRRGRRVLGSNGVDEPAAAITPTSSAASRSSATRTSARCASHVSIAQAVLQTSRIHARRPGRSMSLVKAASNPLCTPTCSRTAPRSPRRRPGRPAALRAGRVAEVARRAEGPAQWRRSLPGLAAAADGRRRHDVPAAVVVHARPLAAARWRVR